MEALDANDPLVGRLVAERYRVARKIADGAQASVYLAKHTLIKRQVALKVLTTTLANDTELVKSFLDEAQVAGTIGHPNIVESLDMGVLEDGRPYLVLEYLEGMSLSDEVHYRGALDPGRAAYVGVQIASALVAVHARGIIHRDLKPDNILLVSRDGKKDHVKIVDFGISKVETTDTRGLDGLVVGTPDYMAPEQVTAPRSVDGRADVFALGACLYEALSGRSPVDLSKASDPLRAVVDAVPEPLARVASGLPQGLVAIIERAMNKDRDRRFASMAELGAALEPFAALPDAAPASSRDPVSGVASMSTFAASDSGRFEAAAITGSFPSLLEKTTHGARASAPAPKRKGRSAVVAAGVVVFALAGVGLLATRNRHATPAQDALATNVPAGAAVNAVLAPATNVPVTMAAGVAVAAPVAVTPTLTATARAAFARGVPHAAARVAGAALPSAAASAAEEAPTAVAPPEEPKVVAVAARAVVEPVVIAPAPAAVAPAPAPTGIVPFGVGMTRPSPISPDEIRYTREAREANVEGAMIVRCVITTTGATQGCRILKGLPFMDAQVLAAFAAHKGTPVTQNGQPINADYTFTVRLKRD